MTHGDDVRIAGNNARGVRNAFALGCGGRLCFGETENVAAEFHHGSFRCAITAKCPILPVCVIDTYKVLDQKGSKPITVQLHFLKPILPEEYKGMKTNQLAELVKARIQACLDEHAK